MYPNPSSSLDIIIGILGLHMLNSARALPEASAAALHNTCGRRLRQLRVFMAMGALAE